MFTTILRFLAIISPFPFYYTLWNWPASFVQQFPKDPSHSMAIISNILKVLQFIAIGTTWHSSKLAWWNIALILAGQYLNYKVYQLLGEAGVYYGVRFGYHIPWVTEFPYGTIQDPQYVGSMLTLLGVSTLVDWRWCAVWIVGYLFMMQVESQEDEKTRVTRKSK